MTARRVTAACFAMVLFSAGFGCNYQDTGEYEEPDGAAGKAGSDEGASSDDSAGKAEQSDGAGGVGGEPVGGSQGLPAAGARPQATAGSPAPAGAAGSDAQSVVACNPTVPPVTNCGATPCQPLGDVALLACEEICCTADGRCGTANTSQEMGRACSASLVQHPSCPPETMLGQQVVGCCRADFRCGVDATQIKGLAASFGFPVEDCFAREDIPDFQPYLTPLDPIPCLPLF